MCYNSYKMVTNGGVTMKIFSKITKDNLSKYIATSMLVTTIAPIININDGIEVNAQQAKKVVEVTCSALNIRSGPSKNYSIKTTLYRGDKVEYISTSSTGWYQIRYNGDIAYISNLYSKIVSENASSSTDSIRKVGRVNISTLNVRSGASTSYSVKNKIKEGSIVGIITSYSNGWAKIKLSSSLTGYVNAKYLDTYSGDSSDINVSYSSTSSYAPSTSSSKVDKVLSTLKSKLGKPYVYGASGPNSFDCSGLTYYCYKQVGVYLNRTSSGQSTNGRYVSKSNLKAGDLVFFNSGSSYIRHVGMYVGDGKFIHAPSPGKTVRYDSIYSSYYSKGYVTARRIIE